MKPLDGEDPQESRNTIQGVRDSLKKLRGLNVESEPPFFCVKMLHSLCGTNLISPLDGGHESAAEQFNRMFFALHHNQRDVPASTSLCRTG
jgi:hypothetical protein